MKKILSKKFLTYLTLLLVIFGLNYPLNASAETCPCEGYSQSLYNSLGPEDQQSLISSCVNQCVAEKTCCPFIGTPLYNDLTPEDQRAYRNSCRAECRVVAPPPAAIGGGADEGVICTDIINNCEIEARGFPDDFEGAWYACVESEEPRCLYVLGIDPPIATDYGGGDVDPDAGVDPAGSDVDPDADTIPTLTTRLGNPLNFDSLEELIVKVIEILITIGIPIGIIFIIWAGFLFITARGDAKQVKEAGQILGYTVLGLFILLGAKIISEVLENTINQILR